MDVTRRDFLTLIAVAGGLGALTPRALAQQLEPERLLDFQDLGNVTLLHMTDAPTPRSTPSTTASRIR